MIKAPVLAALLFLGSVLQAQLPTSSRPVLLNINQTEEQREPEKGQPDTQEEQERPASVPEWVLHFSNLSPEQQALFQTSFQDARQAYYHKQWVACYACLNQCELIFQGNPGVANLKASCLIEQNNYDEAETLTRSSLEKDPNDLVARFNLTSIFMGRQQYAQCVEELSKIIPQLTESKDNATVDVLLFRMFLCHLIMDQEKEARSCIAYVSPLADSPLYYYCQALLHFAQKEDTAFSRDLRTARSLFRNANQTYELELRHSNILSILKKQRDKK